MPQQRKDYLRHYPIDWPVFSTKFFKKDNDGWWNPIEKKKKNNEKQSLFLSSNLDNFQNQQSLLLSSNLDNVQVVN